MKNILLTFFSLISTISMFAQNANTFEVAVKKTNTYLSVYSQVQPYHFEISLNEYTLPKEDILALHKEYNITNDSIDTIDTYEFLGYLQDKIIHHLVTAINQPEFNTAKIENLFHSNLGILISDDGLLYNFMLDEKTGGSYRSYLSFVYYKPLTTELKVTAEQLRNKELPPPYSAFSGDGFTAIKKMTSATNEVQYIAEGYVKGCGTCFITYVSLITLRNANFETDFSYAVETRLNVADISYSNHLNTITITYDTSDLTPDCYCTEEESHKDYNPENSSKKCICIFNYSNGNFKPSNF
ncbi:hypothetical protein [Neptunitalea lumnitzerae]|nr:hypothetical protein [Neptunitalea sp. Y10]